MFDMIAKAKEHNTKQCRVRDELSVVILSAARSTALRVNSAKSKNLRSFDYAQDDMERLRMTWKGSG